MPEISQLPARRTTVEWLMLLAVLLAVGLTLGLSLQEQYERTLAVERERLQGEVRVLGENIGHHIVGADRALAALAGWHEGRAQWDETRLRALGDVIGGVLTLAIVDARGRIVTASRDDLVGKDVGASELFRLAAAKRDPRVLHVAPPAGNAGGVFTISVARVVAAADGGFGGVVMASLDPGFFRVLLDSVRYSADVRSVLAHGDGALFMSVPERGEAVADAAEPKALFERHAAAGRSLSVFEGRAAAGGGESLAAVLSFRPAGVIADKPFLVVVSRDRDAVLEGWRREFVAEVLAFAVMALLAIGLLRWYQRRQREFELRAVTDARARRDATERLALATEASGLGVWEYDLQSRRLLWDERTQAIFGVDAAALALPGYDVWRNALVEEDRVPAEAAFLEAVREARRFRMEFRIHGGDGGVRKILSSGVVRQDGDGKALSVIGIYEDITERWRADEAIRESEARFRLMADSAPVLIWVSGQSLSRGYFNKSWLEFSGRSLAEEIGSGWIDGIHPEDRERVLAIQAEAQRRQGEFSAEYRLRRYDGSYRWILDRAAPRRDAGGEFLGYVGSAIDIEERRRAELDLRTLSRAVEQAAAAVVITDERGTIEYANPAACRTYGYAVEELVGRNPRILQSGQTPPEVYRQMWQTILAGETWRGEIINRRRDGALIEEAATISPVRDELGRIAHFVAIKEDISTKREAERMRRDLDVRLAKLEKMELLGSLAGGIAHDFNNILVAILGFSSIGQTVLKASGGSPRVIGFFEEIEIAGERAKLLVQQLRAFSRGGRLSVQPVRIADVAQEVVNLIGVTFPAAVELGVDIDSELPMINMDPSHLHQLLVNLCANARDAMTGPGHVVITARMAALPETMVCDSCHREFSGEFFRISVRDDGPGISQELRERVFEPFFTTKDVGRGTGMGLAVVHGVAHVYEGHMQLLTEVGQGTELVIYLPQSAPGLDHIDAEMTPAALLEASERERAAALTAADPS